MTLQNIELIKHTSTSSILLVYPYPHFFKAKINRRKTPNKKPKQNEKRQKKPKET